jgi:hypothetical protein
MSPKSFQSDSFTFVYSIRRIFHHLGLHVAVFRVGQKYPPSHSRVIPLPLCTHSQGYFIIYDYMWQCFELVRNVPQVILEWFFYICVLTPKDISSFRTTCGRVLSWSEMSPKSIQSDSFTFVYSLSRIFYHLGLHEEVFRVGQKCPASHSRVIPLPLCTHSQGYFII